MRKAVVAIGLLAVVWGSSDAARGEMVVEWWGKGSRCRHTGMTIELSKYGKEGLINPKAGKKPVEGIHALTFDLSPIPPKSKVYHASLRIQAPLERIRTDRRVYMDIGQGVWYYDPLRIYAEMSQWKPIEIYAAEEGTEPNKAVWDKTKPLALEGPNFRSLDATAAVQDWVNGTKPNLGFVVRQLDFWDWAPSATVLEVCYEGTVKDPPGQVRDLKVVHRKGQTYITWRELDKIIDKEIIEWKEFEPIFKKVSPRGNTFYRIYRHTEPITAANIAQAERINEIWPLSGYDIRMHQHVTQGEEWVGLDPKCVVIRYSVDEPPPGPLKANKIGAKGRREWVNKQLPLHTGLYVHQVRSPNHEAPRSGVPLPKAGKFYYAVTAIVNGIENTRDLTAGVNSLAEPVDEFVGKGEPLLYRIMDQSKDYPTKVPTETQFFLYWAAPPYANLPRHAVHILVTMKDGAPNKDINLIFEGDGMYGSYLQSGANMVHFNTTKDMQIIIVDDAAFASPSYKSNWNTAISSERAKTVPYAQRLVDAFMPWFKQLKPRITPWSGAPAKSSSAKPAASKGQ